MQDLLDIVLFVLAAIVLLPCAVVMIEAVLSLSPPRRRHLADRASRPRVAVLIPAHDERVMIGRTIGFVRPQLLEADRLVVIADNCSDDTSALARAAGAEVIERHDAEHRGKDYALAFGLEHLEADPPEVVIIIDADMVVHERSLHALAVEAVDRNRPVQGLYRLDPPANPRPIDLISSLAFTFKNVVRPMGLDRLGLPCQLMGTGLAVPWPVLRKAPLTTGHLVEDMQLGINLAISGHPPMLCPTAEVSGRLPGQAEAARSQRTRWEHGHLHTLLTQTPRLLWHGMRRGRVDLIAMGLDLAVPPLSLLVMLLLAALFTAVTGAAAFGLSWGPAAAIGAGIAVVAVSVFLGWLKYARHLLPLTGLLAIPFYLVRKVPIYLAFTIRRQRAWVRTHRDA